MTLCSLATVLAQAPVEDIFFRERGAASYSQGVDETFMLIFWISTFFFVLLMGLMILFVIKYRRRPGEPVLRSRSHNTALEITWTVIPTILLAWFFFKGFHEYIEQQVAPANAMRLDLTASKWNWSMTYPNGSGATENTRLLRGSQGWAIDVPVFLVPEDTPIRLVMSSEDVIHSFWVPDFRLKRDVFPNRFTTYWFDTAPLRDSDHDNPDLPYPNREHWIFCAEYCGDNHSEMGAVLRVVPQEVFDDWMSEPFEEGMSLVEVGRTLFSTKGCAQCHTLDGSTSTGPTWQNLWGYESQYSNADPEVIDENAVRESIYAPQVKIRAGFPNQMPTYQGRINNKELLALIALMQSISDRGDQTWTGATWGEAPAEGGAGG